MTEYDLGKVVGDDGEAGNGIASITKTGRLVMVLLVSPRQAPAD